VTEVEGPPPPLTNSNEDPQPLTTAHHPSHKQSMPPSTHGDMCPALTLMNGNNGSPPPSARLHECPTAQLMNSDECP